MKIFYPTQYVESVNHIDYDELKLRNKTTLLFDLDNTIAPFDVEKPTQEVINFFLMLKEKNFKVCIVSNNKIERVEIFNQELKEYIYPKAGKPKKDGILKAIALCGGTLETSVMIGDQMFTDVWVSNRLGIESVLVKPIANRDEFTVKLKRGLEKIVFKKYIKYSNKNKKI